MWLLNIEETISESKKIGKICYIFGMRLHRFYIKTAIENDSFDISERGLIHQWRNVFRYNVGSQVILFDGSGFEYLCLITSLRNLGATVSVIEKKQNNQSFRRNVWLCLGVIKKDNFELALAKATELGINHITPVLFERSLKKNLNEERLQKIITESSEQSGQFFTPELHKMETLESLFKSGFLPQYKIAIDPEGVPFHQYVVGNKFPNIAVFVGSEGGFTKKEIEFFRSYNVPILSLGTQILRAETATIAVSSLLLL